MTGPSAKLAVAVEGTSEFSTALSSLARRGATDLEAVEPQVREILTAVRTEGDSAIRRFVERFEKRQAEALFIRDYGGKAALDGLEPALAGALREAAERIRRYHDRQAERLGGFEYEEDGVVLGGRVLGVDRAGVYVPGGKASYPSSVLMSAIPASVAGVREIIVATPSPGPVVRAACHLAGVHGILDAGGAQAIAALAFGTESVPRVDKIVGPGNLYVAAAKRLVFGEVDIDSIAGPSEILVVTDDSANPAWVAADLLSQAEHDEAAYPLLLTSSRNIVAQVEAELNRQLADLSRDAIARASLKDHGHALVVADRAALARVATDLAAEHVAVHARRPRELADQILRAGAIFIGDATPEAAGDYLAGPSHVLPTGGAARHSAPLGVYDFVSRTSLIAYTRDALQRQAGAITALARAEGLEAHARAVESRLATPGSRQT